MKKAELAPVGKEKTGTRVYSTGGERENVREFRTRKETAEKKRERERTFLLE